MKKYEDFIGGLQQEIEVPDKVWSRFEQTLSDIDNQSMKRRRSGMWVKTAAIAGAIVIAGSAFCVSNPVLAAKIPIVGKIFEQVQNTITFSGNYAKGENLQTGNTESETQLNGTYTTVSNGVTITASEIYSDGYSIFLTAQIKMEQGGLDNACSYLTSLYGEATSNILYAMGDWSIGEDGQKTYLNEANFEGNVVDDNTFIGMIKLDKDDYSVENGEVHLRISEVGYSMDDMDSENLSKYGLNEDGMIEGDWELVVPYSVDQEDSKVIEVDKKQKDGYGIRKVVVSPYQVIVFTDIPYTTLSPEEFTKKDFEELWGEYNKEIIAEGEKPVTYEECLAEKQYEDWEIAVFNQNGVALCPDHGAPDKMIFAVQGLDLKKLHIYIADDKSLGDTSLMNTRDENAAKKISILDAEVDVK